MKVILSQIVLYFSICINCIGQDDSISSYAHVLSRYIQFPSEHYNEKEAGCFLMGECKKRGLHIEVLTQEDTAFNFIASIYPLSLNKPNVVFLNHIDVVPPGDLSLWKFPPYSGTIFSDCIWGRGAIDNKGMAVAELFAIAKFVESSKKMDLPYNISILSVSGEETDGFTGARQISDRFLKRINPCLILGEGGSGVKGIIRSGPDKIVFGISTCEKSKLILNLEMNLPSSGHGSIPPKEYAMKEMIFALEKILTQKPKIEYNKISVQALKMLGKEEKGIRGFVQRHFTFIVFRPLIKREIKKDPVLTSFFANTITFVGLTIPESSDNQISQTVTTTFDCRLLPGTNNERFIRNINKRVKDQRVKIKVIYQVDGSARTNAPEFYNQMSTAIKNSFPNSIALEMIFPATTDNHFFRAKGVPVLGIFPACFEEEELTSVHNINERIHFKSMESAILIYEQFLKSLLSKKSSISYKK